MGITERKEREKQQRRNDIIDAAEKVFFKKGIDNATMDQVAKEAELSKGTLYLYFKSKEELHFAINMRAADIMFESFSKAVEGGSNGLEKIANIGRAYIEVMRKHPDYFEAVMHFQLKDVEGLLAESPLMQDHLKRNPLSLLVKAVEEGKLDGSIRTDARPEVVSHALWAMCTGLLQHLSSGKLKMMEHEGGGEIDPGQYLETFFEIVRKGISNA